jgi:tetratricopeptide (TPR) repeat protein
MADMSGRVGFRRFSQVAFFVSLATLGCGAPASVQKPPTAPEKGAVPSKEKTPYEAALTSLKKGDFARAQTLLQAVTGKDKPQATLKLGELFLMTGRYDEVRSLLSSEKSGAADLLAAEALRRQGKLEEAKAELLRPRDAALPVEFARQVALGEILLEEGKRPEAEAVLMKAIEAANGSRFDRLAENERALCWGSVGKAAHLLRSPEDANEAFNESESLAEAELSILLARARLFVEKFDFAHAEEVLSDAVRLAPHHPDVLLLRAHLAQSAHLDFAEVEDLAHEVLRINPQSTEARFLLAGVALRDLGISEAEVQVEKGLRENPRDLPLLSMKAAVRFLAEDPEGFEQVAAKVQELSPGYTEIFRIVGEYAEWEHRYPDIEKLMRRAVRLDRDDGRARSLLGLTLVRSGSDAAGVVELRRAFDLDPYNVRVLNTLDLYEKTIPENYVEQRSGPFAFRFPKDEAPLLERYVPALLAEAHAEMVARYGYTPPPPIGIEIYESRDQFAVRTSGLPQTAIAGVCFGRKLATVSPIGAPGNFGMTLWHELAHVFHIGLSENRVPRWLTEGLAEWETKRRGVGWSREMDLELYRALREDQIPNIGSMSRAFTHARRMSDVANAYYASGQIAEWIVETRGEKMARDLLFEFGKKKLPPEVVPPLLGAPFEKLDEEFHQHIDKKLERFGAQLVSVEPLLEEAEIKTALKKDPKDYAARFRHALLLLGNGDLKKAQSELTKLAREKFDPQVSLAQARLLLATEKKKEAISLLDDLIQRGHDGLEVRMILGRLHLADADQQTALLHFTQAVTLDPLAEEAWSILAALHHKAGDQEKELAAVRKWAALAEHDVTVHRRLVELLIETKQYEEAKRAGELGIWADLAGFETHRLYGLALFRSGDTTRAEFEFESALLCPASPADIQKLATTWSAELERIGQRARAAKVPERIAKSRLFPEKRSGSPPAEGLHLPDVTAP